MLYFRLTSFLLVFLLVPPALSGQKINTIDSIDNVVKLLMKKKREKFTDMADDSTGRTYEFSRKSGILILACLKSKRDSATTELHFTYDNGMLLRVTCTKWDWKKMQMSMESYYFRNNSPLFTYSYNKSNQEYIKYLQETSAILYERALAFHTAGN
jgi:hypothetical protein